jgi:hypothetical protein
VRDIAPLESIFREAWRRIPAADRAAILSRCLGVILVDVYDDLDGSGWAAASGKRICLRRKEVDSFPRHVLLYIVGHEFAHLADYAAHPEQAERNDAQATEDSERRVHAVLEKRWGFELNPPTILEPHCPRRKSGRRIADNPAAFADYP